MNIQNYKTLVFDCDGVVLDSNKIKTEAFYQAALPYGEAAAQALVHYHVAHGGVSRYKKFDHFLNVLVPEYAHATDGPGLDALLTAYAAGVQEGLLQCQVAEGLDELRTATPNSRWLIVSGGDQTELRRVFKLRDLDRFFDGGIFGSPDTKDEILAREIEDNNIVQPAVFFGDSKYDYQAAENAGLNFIFISAWSEVDDTSTWLQFNKLHKLFKLSDLVGV